jgi:hypothetical protein
MFVLALLAAPILAQQQPQPAATTTESSESDLQQDVAQRSLPLRTALHHDPTLDAPFERLVTMYREAGRLPEIIELYRQHTKTYPADANGAAVLVRLLAAAGDSQSLATARSMAEEHATSAYVQFLFFQALQRARQPGAFDALERAISLSSAPRQRAAWVETLLVEAAAVDQQPLIDKYLKEMATRATTPGEKLEVAERMARYARHAPALALAEEAIGQNPPPEVGVQLEMAAAAAEVALDRAGPAATRLDRLLERLAPDYWGRNEIVRRRLALVTSEQDRAAMVAAARKRLATRPTDEAAAIDLADLLIGFEHRREALAALIESGRKIPNSERIEKLTLELFDRLRDERARQTWLAERLKLHPERADLAALHVKSLLVIGDRAEAHKQLDKLIELLPAAERVPQQLELARSLQKSNLSTDAAEILARVVEALPQRFDLRRELAELYLKLANRSKARELFAGQLPDELDVEQVLDFVPFLIQQELFVEGRRALVKVIKPDDANLDLRLLLVDVERRTGNRASAEKTLMESRALADTTARYTLWIEAAARLHQEDETLEAFIAAEQQRLIDEAGAWSEARLERVLALVDIAGREKSKVNVAELARAWLDDESLPPAMQMRIRQQLVRTIDKTPEQAAELIEQLEELIASRQDDADEYRARLGLIYLKRNEHHLAQPLLHEVRVGQLKDVALLDALEKAYGQFNQPAQVLAVLERLTTLEPASKAHWETWLYHLAMQGREDRLRDTLRRLVAGIDGLALEEPVRTLLVSQLVDSYGRSVLASLTDGRPAALSDSLAMLGAVERLVNTPQQAVWVVWNRAYILNRLGRTEPRDEAIAELDRILVDALRATKVAKKPVTAGTTVPATPATDNTNTPDIDTEADRPTRLRFPDGLTLSLDNAKRLLTAPPHVPNWPRADVRTGPLPKLSVRWALDLPNNRPLEKLLASSPDRVIVADALGTLYAVDAAGGKVLWQRDGALPVLGGNVNLQTTYSVRLLPPVAVPVADHERIYFAHDGEVTCLSTASGETLWQSAISSHYELKDRRAKSTVLMPVFLRGNELVAYDPAQDAIAALACDSGKVVWTYEIGEGRPLDAARLLIWLTTGAALDGDRLFVYGRRTALVNLARREVEWTIEPELASKLPVKLDPPTTPTTTPAYGTPTASPFASRFTSYTPPASFYAPASASSSAATSRYVDYQRRSTTTTTGESTRQLNQTSLVGPAGLWSVASREGHPRFAVLNDNRLMLASNDRISTMDIDLPIAGRNNRTVGTYLGCIGQHVCFLRANEFYSINLVDGRRGYYTLNDVTGGLTTSRLQAVIDGPLVYVTGPRGLVCINVLAGKRVFRGPWPEGAELAADDPRWPADAGGVDQSSQYLWNGVSVPLSGAARCTPPIGAVFGGTLYVAITPWRVVAIEGAVEP